METIKLSGIDRYPQAQDKGACQEIINLRFRDGSLVPVGKKKAIESSPGVPAAGLPNMFVVFIHTVDADTDPLGDVPHGKNYLGYQSSSGDIVTWEPSNPAGLTTIGNVGAGKESHISFTAIKNMVIVIDRVDKKIVYLLWKDSTYTFLSKKFPEMIPLTMLKRASVVTKRFNWISDNSPEAVYGTELTEMRKRGFDEGIVTWRLAYEMFDGSVVGHSAPQIMTLDPLGRILNIAIVDVGVWTLSMAGGKPYIQWANEGLGAEIMAELETSFKHIIKGVTLYMTKPIPSNNIRDIDKASDWQSSGATTGGLSSGVPYSQIQHQEIFYKYQTMTIEEIKTGNINLEPGDLNHWESREIMPQDDYTNHSISAAAKMVYNGRLMLGDITTKLFKGYTPDVWFSPKSGSAEIAQYKIIAYTTILTEEGIKKVACSSIGTYIATELICPVLISYPDGRATKIEIVKEATGTGIKHLIASYNLTRNPSHNVAQCLIQQEIPTPVYLNFAPAIPEVFTTPALRDTYTDSNVAKLSALNNPMQFPARNTYAVGLSKIVAFETSALAISQGQFGQYPVLVFTDSGMWAMELGGGGTTIQNVVPLNGFICNNPNSITKIDKSLIFSTKEGLIMLTGSEDVLISQPLRGDHNSPLQYNAEAELFSNYMDGTDLVRLGDSISKVDFSTFLANAKIGYDNIHRELIISNAYNGGYSYSYIYSLDNNTWTKISEKFKHFINDFPSCYGVRSDDRMVDLTTEDSMAVDTLIITREVNSDELVKLIRLGIKATIDADEAKITGMYLFGSVDSREWSLITGIQQSGSFNNPYVNRALMSFRYSIVMLAGNLRQSSHIHDVNIDLKFRYANKLIR
jgi:hypothetical protein